MYTPTYGLHLSDWEVKTAMEAQLIEHLSYIQEIRFNPYLWDNQWQLAPLQNSQQQV